MQAIVNISLKEGVLDPQGQAILRSLNDLGFNEVSDVRVGKQILLEIDENDSARLRQRVARMCEALLANTVMKIIQSSSLTKSESTQKRCQSSPTSNAKQTMTLSALRVAIIVFPGSNCDRDMMVAIERLTSRRPALVWHKASLDAADLVIIPGGFSFGDYLRCGALAGRSPITNAVLDHAARSRAVMGIATGSRS